jgi:hypothetical protein
MPVRFSGSMWLWASLAVLFIAILLIRLFAPHHVHAPVSEPIPDRSITSPLNQPGGGVVPAEAYEIYSALYASTQPEPLAFAEDSLTDIPQVNGNCLKPSNADERELAVDFEAANKQSHRWQRSFAVSSPYLLLSKNESAEAQSCIQARSSTASPDCAAYAQLRHVRYLGIPGFNRAHTRALVSVIKMCGAQCGSGGIFEVKRSGNTWLRADSSDFTRDCSWMY